MAILRIRQNDRIINQKISLDKAIPIWYAFNGESTVTNEQSKYLKLIANVIIRIDDTQCPDSYFAQHKGLVCNYLEKCMSVNLKGQPIPPIWLQTEKDKLVYSRAAKLGWVKNFRFV